MLAGIRILQVLGTYLGFADPYSHGWSRASVTSAACPPFPYCGVLRACPAILERCDVKHLAGWSEDSRVACAKARLRGEAPALAPALGGGDGGLIDLAAPALAAMHEQSVATAGGEQVVQGASETRPA